VGLYLSCYGGEKEEDSEYKMRDMELSRYIQSEIRNNLGLVFQSINLDEAE